MKSIPKEYNVVVACGFTALLMLGGFGYFAFDSLSLESEGLEALAAVSEKIEKFNKSTTPPTDSYLKELVEQKNELIYSLYDELNTGRLKLEPYPASLRIMNLIRFVNMNEISSIDKTQFLKYIKSESNYLEQNLEFHILGNHLLENLFALKMVKSLFEEDASKIEKLLMVQLNEQILIDGAHFELSPMYHKIILFRMLEMYTYISENDMLKSFTKEKIDAMHSWLKNIGFSNGEVPAFNDSTTGITFSNAFLFTLCQSISKNQKNLGLSDSGYRMFNTENFELAIDVHGISPSYQPGHAHADTFSFCLNYENTPYIVDTGISTYNISKRRTWERSTNAHNTIEINNENSAEVWSGFRVGRRLKVKILEEDKNHLKASHNGYKRFNIDVLREIDIDPKSEIISIIDKLVGKINGNTSQLNIHFHPSVKIVKIKENVYQLNEKLLITFEGDINTKLDFFEYSEAYNSFSTATKLIVELNSETCKTFIYSIK